MVAPIPEDSRQPIRLPTAIVPPLDPPESAPLREKPKSRMPIYAFLASVVLSGTWMGAIGAYLMGYFRSRTMAELDVQELAIFIVATFIPPLLFMAVSWVLIRGQAMGEAAETFAEAAAQLFSADETATRTATRIGRAVRHELDALNAGLDTAFGRMRALESILETQISALDNVASRLDVQGDTLSDRLANTCVRIEASTAAATEAAAKSGETMAGRASLLKATIEAAENSLQSAGGALETQTANFRAAAGEAAEAPHAAAIELEKQVKRIESVADAAVARAEFVLGRQERHRVAMNEMLQRLKDEGLTFETALTAEREAMERMLATLDAEAKKFEAITGESQRRLDAVMASAASRTSQLAQTYAREAVHLKETGDAAAKALLNIVGEMQKAGTNTQVLVGETTAKARADASGMVGAAMAEVAKLLHAADELTIEAKQLRATLSSVTEDVERHVALLPDVAKEEAAKVREMVRLETEEILNLSARTLSTLHAKSAPKPVLTLDRPAPREEEAAGLRFLKRKLATPKPAPKPEAGKGWQMSALLAAAETAEAGEATGTRRKPAPRPTASSSVQMLQEALADMAVDLDAIASDEGPSLAEWRRYLEGDRVVFARKLAGAIDGETVHRIAMLYRENAGFRDCANAYLEEFESLLEQVREGGGGGLLATTLLSADTGKIYLAISYALGRM
jgi:hypothetical protein